MKHLFYVLVYALALVDCGSLTWVIVIMLLVGMGLAVHKTSCETSSDPVSSYCVTTELCRVLEPTVDNDASVKGVESTATGLPGEPCTVNGTDPSIGSCMINGTGATPRRQRSLRERTGIDGKLDKLNPNSVLTNTLAPSPSVSAFVNPEYSRPVRKMNFAEHLRFMAQDHDARFVQEFKDLNQAGRGKPCTAADLAYNRPKNRFANILPFDHSRVKLSLIDGVEGSDYINASYIPGYNGKKEFICTQGPLASTRDDFWRMVWEQESIVIVNLTSCLEKGREKCARYWPEFADTVTYGNVQISLNSDSKLSFGTIREFKLNCGPQSRTVYQFHFTAWPDFGVPERPQTLVKFVRAFRAHILSSSPDTHHGPVIVHCSAGVGRSGTMIAIDRILQCVRGCDDIDVYGTVYEMRMGRYWMVQTEQQYVFIHQCILCVLEGLEDENELSMILNTNSTPTSPCIEFSSSFT